MPLSPRLAEHLRAADHDAVHASQRGLSTASDAEVLECAREECRIVVTADLDFPQLLALARAEGPGVILFRGGSFSEAQTGELVDRLLRSEHAAEVGQSVTVLERHRIRRTRLPLDTDQ
jgi:predicted nuclease of predicted toxin-antitoxin system